MGQTKHPKDVGIMGVPGFVLYIYAYMYSV